MSFSESDLYAPVKDYFTRLGYEVYGEVKDCDVVAVKKDGGQDEIVAVELKTGFNLKLVYQLLERATVTPRVYAAIPRPKNMRGKNVRNMLRLMKAVGAGLIVVAIDSPLKTVEVLLAPGERSGAPARTSSRKKAAVIREISGRLTDLNTGGVNNTKINTAYREKCIKLACVLERHGGMSAAYLRGRFGCGKDTNAVLRTNIYGWFTREGKGVYSLSEPGSAALFAEAPELVEFYREFASKN